MSVSPPEVWIIRQQTVEPGIFEDEVEAEIHAGKLAVYGISLIRPRTDENWDDAESWDYLDDCWNYTAPPGYDNFYGDPRNIGDEWLRYYATDMWAYTCGIFEGHLVRYQGETHWVMSPEYIDQDYGSIGTATGYLHCIPTSGGRPARIWVGDVTPVLEMTA